MATILAGTLTQRSDDLLGVDELRSNALRLLGAWVMGCGVLALAILYDPDRIVTWLPSIALTVAGYTIYRLARVITSLASGLFVIALWSILTGCIVLYPGDCCING